MAQKTNTLIKRFPKSSLSTLQDDKVLRSASRRKSLLIKLDGAGELRGIKPNLIIKRNNLLRLIRISGMKRVNPNALKLIEKKIVDDVSYILEILKEEIAVQGRKTIKKEDVLAVLERLGKKNKSDEV